MPFTLSHTVLAPPLAKLTGHRLPIAALAIGTMTPDLYRILVKTEIYLNHQWKGIIYPDLVVGLLFCFLWYCLYRPFLFQLLGLKKDLNIHSLRSFCTFIISMLIAIIIGTATHIIWDGLTHLDFRTFAFSDFLAQPVTLFSHSYPMHRVLQIGTSALALPFIGWMAIHYYSQYKQVNTVNFKLIKFAMALFSVSFIVGCCSYLYIAKQTGFYPPNTDLYTFIGFFMKSFTQGSILCFSLGCILFFILNRQRFFD